MDEGGWMVSTFKYKKSTQDAMCNMINCCILHMNVVKTVNPLFSSQGKLFSISIWDDGPSLTSLWLLFHGVYKPDNAVL